jgi:FeS assembly SUF system protein
MNEHSTQNRFEVEYVDSVEPPPKAPPLAASAAEPRRRDYLEGFLSGQAQPGPDGDEPLREAVIAALREIHDPEIPVNIYDLGLVYGVAIEDGHVTITMTLTTPHCPVAESMPAEVEIRTMAVPGVASAEVKLVWDPPWDPHKMSDEARLELGML